VDPGGERPAGRHNDRLVETRRQNEHIFVFIRGY
jgi:hypothetical protein